MSFLLTPKEKEIIGKTIYKCIGIIKKELGIKVYISKQNQKYNFIGYPNYLFRLDFKLKIMIHGLCTPTYDLSFTYKDDTFYICKYKGLLAPVTKENILKAMELYTTRTKEINDYVYTERLKYVEQIKKDFPKEAHTN